MYTFDPAANLLTAANIGDLVEGLIARNRAGSPWCSIKFADQPLGSIEWNAPLPKVTRTLGQFKALAHFGPSYTSIACTKNSYASNFVIPGVAYQVNRNQLIVNHAYPASFCRQLATVLWNLPLFGWNRREEAEHNELHITELPWIPLSTTIIAMIKTVKPKAEFLPVLIRLFGDKIAKAVYAEL